jgi:hypothetical protein
MSVPSRDLIDSIGPSTPRWCREFGPSAAVAPTPPIQQGGKVSEAASIAAKKKISAWYSSQGVFGAQLNANPHGSSYSRAASSPGRKITSAGSARRGRR